MTEPTTTGTDLVRQALTNRNRQFHLAAMARNIGVATDILESFAEGKRELPIEVLQKLAGELFGGHVELDPATNLLRSTNQAKPVSIGTPPPPFEAGSGRYTFEPRPMAVADHAPRPLKPEPAPKPKGRPGWLGGFL